MVEIILNPKEKDLGDGLMVRRTLPALEKRKVGPFIFWDHGGPITLAGEQDMLVRAHPHIGLATVSWVVSGKVFHRDNLGNEQEILPGEVNWMTAGRGIVHSERAKDCDLELIQIWVALPEDQEDVNPNFIHKKEKDLPQINHNGASLRLIVGKALGHESPIEVFSDIFYLNGSLEKDLGFELNLEPHQEGAIYLLKGKINTQERTMGPGQMAVFKQGSPISFSTKENSEFMLLGGEKFPRPPKIWWNFVSHDPKKIEKAKSDWKEGRFPKVPNETEYIPLPEK